MGQQRRFQDNFAIISADFEFCCGIAIYGAMDGLHLAGPIEYRSAQYSAGMNLAEYTKMQDACGLV